MIKGDRTQQCRRSSRGAYPVIWWWGVAFKNPHGVENDIRKLSSEKLEVEAIIVPER
jgi:hypothetical protein